MKLNVQEDFEEKYNRSLEISKVAFRETTKARSELLNLKRDIKNIIDKHRVQIDEDLMKIDKDMQDFSDDIYRSLTEVKYNQN